jgi:predicted ATPase/class 3 adenylate cyclase
MAVDSVLLDLPARATALGAQLLRLLPVELQGSLTEPASPAPDRRAIHAHLVQLLTALNAVVPGWLVQAVDARAASPVYGQAATLLLADVTGFTPLTARLATRGRSGTESLTATLNQLFATIVPIALAYDGDLLAFGGDAILVAFRNPGHALAAISAAWQMQRALVVPDREPISAIAPSLRVQMKIGVASGPLVLASVGTATRCVPISMGCVLDAVDMIASATAPGGIRLDARAASAAAPLAELAMQPDGSALLLGLRGELPPVGSVLAPADAPAMPDLSALGIGDLVARIGALAPYLPADLFAALAGTPERAPGDGEQRHVISLFVHLAGLHELADGLGLSRAEQSAALAALAISRALTVIESYGGVVARVDTYPGGHKLLALFGAPVAHEQEAQRAVQAALALRAALPSISAEVAALIGDALGPSAGSAAGAHAPLGVRVGIHAGPVVAGLIGSPRRWEYTVMGDSVNVAARLMGSAGLAQSEVLVGSGIAEQLGEQLEAEARTLLLKGKHAPLTVWSVERLRPGARPRPAQATPLVGRDRERRLLHAAAQSLRDGRAALVFIRGEAGIGKTRLAGELAALLGPKITCVQTGSPGLVPVSFGLFRALLLALAEQTPDRAPSAAVAELRALVERSCPGRSAELWPALTILLGLDGADPSALGANPAAQQRTLAAAVISILAGAAAERPLAWLCEDLHAVDDASLVVFEQLLALGWQLPLLLCATLRSSTSVIMQPAQRLVLLGVERFGAAVTVLDLVGLSAAAGAALLERLLPNLTREACAALLAHTDGNPLFLEVLAQTVQQQNVLRRTSAGLSLRASLETLGIPRTLRELVTAQVDHLPPEVRPVARAAAVIAAVDGAGFSTWLLEQLVEARHTVGPRLRALAQAQVVEEVRESRSRVREDARRQANGDTRLALLPGPVVEEQARRYLFRHALYQQAAYDQLLERERRELHRRAGLALHERAIAGQEVGVEALAYHCYAGCCWELAARYSLAAGQRALRTYANGMARRYLRRALGLARRLGWPQQEAEAREGLGELAILLGRYPPARAQLERALRRGVPAQDDPALVAAQARRYRLLALVAERTGAYDESEAYCDTGLALLADPRHPPVELARLQLQRAEVRLRRGDLSGTEQACRAGLEAIRATPAALREHIALTQRLATVEGRRGNYNTAKATLAASLALARPTNDAGLIAQILHNLGIYQLLSDQREQALDSFEESLRLKEQIGDTVGRIRTVENIGLVHVSRGSYSAALRCFLECCDLCSQLNLPQSLASATGNLGHLWYIQGQPDQALLYLLKAHAIYASLADTDGLADCLYRLGDVALVQGRPEQACSYGEQALTLARQMSSEVYQACALRVIGEALLAQRRLAEAEAFLEQARLLQARVANRYDQTMLLVALVRLRVAQGRAAEGEELAQAALALAREQAQPFLLGLAEGICRESGVRNTNIADSR